MVESKVMNPPSAQRGHGATRRPIARDNSFLTGGGKMGQLIRETDWSKTSIGPMESWPQSLLTSLSICLSSKFPTVIYWGPKVATFYNDGYARILGSKHPWAIGRPVDEVWAEIWDDIKDMVETVVSTGEANWCEDALLNLQRNGYAEECYFTFSFAPIRVESGAVGGIYCSVTETTQRVLGERRLRLLRDLGQSASNARTVEVACKNTCHILSENNADVPFALIYSLDSTGQEARLICSPGFEAGHAASPNTIKLDDEQSAWPLNRVARTKTEEVVSGLAIHIENSATPLTVHSAIVLPLTRSERSRPYGFAVLGISPRRELCENYRTFFHLVGEQLTSSIANARAYEEERQRAEALAEIDRAKTAFFTNISHEFRTPLTLLLGPAEEALSDSATPPADRERLEVIHRNGLRLQKLVNSLLDFSRLEAGRAKAAYVETDLAALTSDLGSVFRSLMEKAGLKFTVDCPPLPEPVFVDRDMWEKIVFNLLSNAFKFTPRGEVEIKLRAENFTKENAEAKTGGTGDPPVPPASVVLTVRDTGTGIPPEELPKLFKRFHRIENPDARTHEGTGIGLALANGLVKLHGGKIEVESAPGKGTEFRVRIPFGKNHLRDDRVGVARGDVSTALLDEAFVGEALTWLSEEAGEKGGKGERESENATAPPSSPRILLVEDNADMRDYVRRLLSSHFIVQAVPDGATGLEAARKEPPDLILSDVMMPGMSGFELTRQLRADEKLSSTPVILLSARAGEEDRVDGMSHGADDYLTKPFSARELLARVNTHLKIAQARREASEQLRRSNVEMKHRLRELEQANAEIRDSRRATLFLMEDVMRTQEALRESEQKTNRALDYAKATLRTSPVPLLVLEKDFRVNTANEAFYQIFHVNPAETEGRLVYGLGDGQWNIPKLRELLEDILPRQTMFRNFEVTHEFADIGRRTMLLNARRMENEPDMPERIVLVIEDITERTKAADDLRQAHELLADKARHLESIVATRTAKLQEMVGELESVSYSIAHDMRAPLRAMQNFSSILLDDYASKLDGEGAGYLKKIQTAAARQDSLIQDVLVYSRVLRESLPMEPIDLEKLFGEIIETYPHLQPPFIEIKIAGKLPVVLGNAAGLTQIVSNLLGNAAKFVMPGVQPHVKVRSEEINGDALIWVEDNGIGIEEKDQRRIFKIFERVPASQSYEGTGIGLAIVRKAAERMGAKVGVESAPGQGSRFWVQLQKAADAQAK